MSVLKGKTILIADDEPDLRELLGDEFRFQGSNVLEASNGIVALDLLSKNKVDVVISDVRMPDMDGAELLEKIRQIDPVKPYVFLLTGYGDLDVKLAVGKGATALFLKPIDWGKLISQIEDCLKGKPSV